MSDALCECCGNPGGRCERCGAMHNPLGPDGCEACPTQPNAIRATIRIPVEKATVDEGIVAGLRALGLAGGDIEAPALEEAISRAVGSRAQLVAPLAASVVDAFELRGLVVRLGPRVRLTREGWRAWRTEGYARRDE